MKMKLLKYGNAKWSARESRNATRNASREEHKTGK